MPRKSFTLIELILVSILVGFVIFGISATSLFFIRQIAAKRELYNIYSQINQVFEDMKLRCISANSIPLFFSGSNNPRGNLEFRGERQIYNIKPDDAELWNGVTGTGSSGSKVWYRYSVDETSGDLVLEKTSEARTNYVLEEVLLESKYNPNLSFEWVEGSPPDMLKVTIGAAGSHNGAVSQTTGIRFWFLDVAG